MTTTAYFFFWVDGSIRARDPHIRFGLNYFPQWFDSRRTGITACRFWAKASDSEKIGFTIFVAQKIAAEQNHRDIRHFLVPGHIQQLSNLSSDLTQIAQIFSNFPGPGSGSNDSENSEKLCVY